MIPKKIYRSWFTQNLPYKVEKEVKKLKKQNPNYEHIIYTDSQIDDYVNSNFDKDIKTAFNSLKHIVPKVDFWRYLIIFENGGVYLDIDSSINKPLDEIIKKENDAIITSESNDYKQFVQWGLIFKKEHPLLEKTIDNVTQNVLENKYPNYLTEPSELIKLTASGPFTNAVDYLFKKYKNEKIDWNKIYLGSDSTFFFGEENNEFNIRILGVDFNGLLSWKSKSSYQLYETKQHWLKDLNDNAKNI